MKSAASRRAPSVSFHSGELGLADWLKFSWFYPEGFQGEELLESPRAWLVLGNGIAYKFLKSNDKPGNPARDRWRKSCQELLDNAPLAGPVYLGLRCLHEDEGQLIWESRSRSMEEKPHRMPRNVQDVALVLRRLNLEDRLDRLMRPSEPTGPAAFARIAESLAAFHESRSEEQRRDVQPSPDQFFSLTEDRHLNTLRAKLLRSESTLDRTTTRGLEELLNYLSKFLSGALPYFRDRHLSGNIHDCHRNVRTRTIFMLREPLEGPRSPVVISRRMPDSGQRIDDCLFDIASLSTDLESRGDRPSAERFEDEYFALRPRSFQSEAFEFYKAAAACEQLLAAYSGDARDEDQMERTDQLLSLALRLANGLNRPAIIFYQQETSTSRESGEKLASLLGAEHVTEETGLPDYLDLTLPEEFLVRRVLLRCRELLQQGKVVVFALKGIRWITAEELDEFLARTPCFRAIVRPPGVPAESIMPQPGTPPEKQLPIGNVAFLSDCFPPLEQAFLALRELSWLASSMRSK